jgi:hypothetical protein
VALAHGDQRFDPARAGGELRVDVGREVVAHLAHGQLREGAWGAVRAAGLDVHQAQKSIGAVQGRGGAADDLDPLDGRKRDQLGAEAGAARG